MLIPLLFQLCCVTHPLPLPAPPATTAPKRTPEKRPSSVLMKARPSLHLAPAPPTWQRALRGDHPAMMKITHVRCSFTIHKALSRAKEFDFHSNPERKASQVSLTPFSTRKLRLQGAPRYAQETPTKRQSSRDSDHTLLSPSHELFKREEAASPLLTSEATGQVDPPPTCLQVRAPPASAASIHGREQRASSWWGPLHSPLPGNRKVTDTGQEMSAVDGQRGACGHRGSIFRMGSRPPPATNHSETKGKLGPRTPGSWALEGLNTAWLLPTSWANFNPVSEPPNGDEDINITMYFQPQWRRVNKVLQPRPQWKLPSSSTVSIIITHK